MRLRLACGALLGALVGCSGSPSTGGLRVTVELEAGLTSRCAKVLASGASERESGPVLLDGRSRFVVGIAQDGERAETRLEAVGYSDDGCTFPTLPAERSDLVVAGFTPEVAEVTLLLRKRPTPDAGTDAGTGDAGTDAGVDADGDGFPLPEDCDDTNADIKPGATELCFDGLDNDCDALVDCADTVTCEAMTCSTTGRCASSVCVAPTEQGLCADGLDNDGDLLVDCADADCPMGTACSDQNACTLGDVCGAGGTCQKASDRTCTTPPAAQCFAATGACLPDAGGVCQYAVTTGGCNDGLACTTGDTCRADGGCSGTAKSCSTPPSSCYASAGQCEESRDGGCAYATLAAGTGTCSDGNNCTTMDRCDGDGGCRGTAVTCTPPDECRQWAGTCQGNGTCNFTVLTGQACGDGGWSCNGSGACVAPAPTFPYTPSNFTEAQLPTASGALTVGCNTTVDTLAADGGVGWTTCGGGPARPNHVVITVGGNPAVLFFMDSLTVNGGNTFRVTGARPAIFAVRTTATIGGTIDVGSTPTSAGAGGELSCGAGFGQNGSAGGSPQSGGGAGGGGFGLDGADGSDAEDGSAKGGKGVTNGGVAPLRGGCRGGHGGRFDSTNANGTGRGGWGGGALQISVGTTLTVNGGGIITAHGAGGGGGASGERIGGGGGGSGGAVLLEGAEVRVNGGSYVTANGGAGGEGSGDTVAGGTGQNGDNNSATPATSPDNGCGANGGSGGTGTDLPGTGGARETSNCNSIANKPGGGGGGGVGRIHFRASTACTIAGAALVSPAQTGAGTGCP